MLFSRAAVARALTMTPAPMLRPFAFLIAMSVLALQLGACATDPPAPTAASASDAARTLTIQGALSYRARIALPATAYAVVDVKQGEGPVLAAQRVDLNGRQVPIPFVVTVPRERLRDDGQLRLRGVVFADGREAWSTQPVPIDTKVPVVDTGVVWMASAQAAGAFATTWRCGGQEITLDHTESFTQLLVRTERFRMRPVPASGAGMRFEGMSDPSTSLAYEGTKARLTVRGNAYPECTETGPAMPLR